MVVMYLQDSGGAHTEHVAGAVQPGAAAAHEAPAGRLHQRRRARRQGIPRATQDANEVRYRHRPSLSVGRRPRAQFW